VVNACSSSDQLTKEAEMAMSWPQSIQYWIAIWVLSWCRMGSCGYEEIGWLLIAND